MALDTQSQNNRIFLDTTSNSRKDFQKLINQRDRLAIQLNQKIGEFKLKYVTDPVKKLKNMGIYPF
jgi:hypothetical protein